MAFNRRETAIIARFGVENLANVLGDMAKYKSAITAMANEWGESEAAIKAALRHIAAEQSAAQKEIIKGFEDSAKARIRVIDEGQAAEQAAFNERLAWMRSEAEYLARTSRERLQTQQAEAAERLEITRSSVAETEALAIAANEAQTRSDLDYQEFKREQLLETEAATATALAAETEEVTAAYEQQMNAARAYNQAELRLRRTAAEELAVIQEQEVEEAGEAYHTRLQQVKAYNQSVTALRRAEAAQLAALNAQISPMGHFGQGFAMTAMGGPIGGALAAATGTMNPYAVAGMEAYQGLSLLYEQGLKGRESEYAMRQLSMYMGEAKDHTQQLTSTVRELAMQLGTTIPEAADAMREAISMAVSPENASKFVMMANQLALIKGTDVGQEVHTLAGIKNAFGMTSPEMGHATDVLSAMREKAHVDITPGQMGGMDVLANESGMSFDEVMMALGTMAQKDVMPDRAIAALRQLMTKEMFPTPAAQKAQDEAHFHFNKESVAQFGFIEALNRLIDALDEHGVTIKQALGTESNRGTVVAIEALLDKAAMGRMKSIIDGSGGAADTGAHQMMDTEEYRAKQRGAAWSQIGQRAGGWMSNLAAGASILGLESMGVNVNAAQEQEDRETRHRSGDAIRDEKRNKAAERDAKRLRDVETEKNLEARRQWELLDKQIQKTEKSVNAFGKAEEKALNTAIKSNESKIQAWEEYIIHAKDAMAQNDEKQADKLAKRGDDYSTRSKTGTILSVVSRMTEAHTAATAAGIRGDIPALTKESTRFQDFTGQLRGMDLTTIGKIGMDWNEVNKYIDQQVDDLPRAERFKARTDLRQQARGFERDVMRSYNKFSVRPDLHADVDFGKWYADAAMSTQMKEEHKAEETSLAEAESNKDLMLSAAKQMTLELEQQKKINAELIAQDAKRLEINRLLPIARLLGLQGLNQERKDLLRDRGLSRASPESGGSEAQHFAETLRGPKGFSLGDSAPVIKQTVINDNRKPTIIIKPTGTMTEEQAKVLTQKIQEALDRGSATTEPHK